MMIFKGFLCFLGFLLVAKPIIEWLETKLVYRDDGYGVARDRVVEEQMKLGATYGEAQETLFLREMLARVRREASDAVQSDPTQWLQCIENAKARAVGEIASYKPHLAQGFAQSVDALTYGHVLYPAEARMVDKLWVGSTSRPNPDQRAAVRMVR